MEHNGELPELKMSSSIGNGQLERHEALGADNQRNQSSSGSLNSEQTKEETIPKPEIIANIEEYRPQSATHKQIYSMKELLKLSKTVPDAALSKATVQLPKKSFWRLTSRHPDIRQSENGSSNGNGHKNEANYGAHEAGGEKKGHRNRNSRNGRRGSKFAKGEKAFVEEKDIKVNNDELLALEEEIQPTGNSIVDFENWRAKMKELERKKMGLTSKDSSTSIRRPSLNNNGSSISDFFNLKRESSSNFEELEPQGTASESLKSSHSRFSSFFNSTPSPAISKTQSTVAQPPTPREEEARPAAGSRILSFFDKMDSKNSSTSLTDSNAEDSQPLSRVQNAPVHEQTNNHFFQGLLNRGKATPTSNEGGVPNDKSSNSSTPTVQSGQAAPKRSPDLSSGQQTHSPAGPPGLSKVPSSKRVMSPQTQPGFPVGMPPNVYPANTQPIARPPPGFQPFQMPPPGAGLPQQFYSNQRPTNEFSRAPKNEDNNPGPTNMQLPFIPGPRGMPPPGFPPMHGMPPGMSQEMPMPMNNMMPPPGFYPSQGPSFNQFGNPSMHLSAMNGPPPRQAIPPRKE